MELTGFETESGSLREKRATGLDSWGSGQRGGWVPSLGAGGGQNSWVLAEGRTEHLGSWVLGMEGAESQDS